MCRRTFVTQSEARIAHNAPLRSHFSASWLRHLICAASIACVATFAPARDVLGQEAATGNTASADSSDGSPDSPTEKETATGKSSLARFQWLVGEWRGVGQIRRGSNQGAWSEEANWRWKFDKSGASLLFDSPQGKHIVSASLRPASGEDAWTLTVRLPRAKDVAKDQPAVEVVMTGKHEEDRLVFSKAEGAIDNAAESSPDRITIRQTAGGDRLLMLYERRSTGERFVRLGEVGSTRVGSRFGQGTTMVECVVTGGAGTIPVTFEGKTYYVCCTGCRDLFNEDPAGVLAEYRARKAAEAEPREKDERNDK